MSRTQVLGRIRQALGRDALSERDSEWLAQRSVPVPAGAPMQENSLALFIERAEAVGSQVEQLEDPAELPERLTQYCRDQGIEAPIWISPAWPQLQFAETAVSSSDALPEVPLALTSALAGIAETGTLVVDAGLHPATANFLPEHHLVVLPRAQIVATLEDWLARRPATEAAVNTFLIAGPSRTADIEQVIERGAHGPRALVIWLV